jgi:hypothetical protein
MKQFNPSLLVAYEYRQDYSMGIFLSTIKMVRVSALIYHLAFGDWLMWFRGDEVMAE